MQRTISFLKSLLITKALVFATFSQAAGPVEQTFKDPVTGKSGRYAAAFGKRQGLLVFFHGSGNTSGYAGVFDNLAAVAKEFDLVPIAIQAPNNAVTWPEGPHAPNNQHVAYVRSLLEREIFLKHPEINRERLYFVGFSAGSTFLSGDLLPAAIKEYRGGAVLLCGGGGPVEAAPALFQNLSAAEAQKFRLYFFIQKNDFLYPQTLQGVSYWQKRGAQVQIETPTGGGHCAFDFQQELSKGIKALINK